MEGVFTKLSVSELYTYYIREYIHKGISVWLDVPLEALARRVAADGTNSRPLLHGEGDAYTQVRLFTIYT